MHVVNMCGNYIRSIHAGGREGVRREREGKREGREGGREKMLCVCCKRGNMCGSKVERMHVGEIEH